MFAPEEKCEHRGKNGEKADLMAEQVELVKLQRHFIETGQQILVVSEGRDAAGKDGMIKRIVQPLEGKHHEPP